MPSATASQTIGPFWHLIEHPEWADLTRFGAAGERITLTGSVIDGDGNPVTDAAVELWQADPPADESFPGFGRCRTDERGEFRFTTVKPGPVPGRGNAQQAPHFAIALHARGLAQSADHARLFRGRAAQRDRPAVVLDRGCPAPRDAARPSREREQLADRHPAATRAAAAKPKPCFWMFD